MSRNITFIITLSILTLFLFVGMLAGRKAVVALGPDAHATCAVKMGNVIQGGQGDVYNFSGVTKFDEPKVYYLVEYPVNGDALGSPNLETVPPDLLDERSDRALQNEAWHIFTKLIPLDHRQMVSEFNIFTDGTENTLAAVDQSHEDASSWSLEVDIADLANRDEFLFTIIHEYAHLLTLNASQVTPDIELVNDPYNLDLQKKKAAACPNYFTGVGCSYPDSYIQAFYDRFWTSINSEWETVDALQYGTNDLIPYYNGLYALYKEHQDQFMDDYSVTHPTEDIAESFTYFVFSSKPVGNNIRDQKVAFFYGYPELIQLREDILNGACKLE